ncbi:MAG TPA: hypothetical protein VFE74_08770, partial [Ramlibacter sp.]|nr:hypothetical protein [Ramlibacter sp.]
ALARPDPGLSKPERGRAVRAHHHKLQHKKDYTRDDSIDPQPTTAPAASGPAGKPADPGPGASSPGKNPK